MEVVVYSSSPSKNDLLDCYYSFEKEGCRELAGDALGELQKVQQREDVERFAGLRRELASF